MSQKKQPDDVKERKNEEQEQEHKQPGLPDEPVETRQLIPTVEGTALATYANRPVLMELVDRLMVFHPAAREVGRRGMFLAAQLAVMMGASPLPSVNEIHIWLDPKTNQVVVTPGYNYWQRRAEQKGGVWWVTKPRPMTDEELNRYDVASGVVAAICEGLPARLVTHYAGKLGMPIETVLEAHGATGLGTVTPNEYTKKGRPPIWTAMKRARVDALRQIFPYIPGEKLGEGGVGMVIDNETGNYVPDWSSPAWAELDPGLREMDSNSPVATMSLDEINDDLYPEQPDTYRPQDDPALDPDANSDTNSDK